MNNISETLFQSIDTIVLQHLNSISYDKTEICKVISQDQNNKCKYWVSNGAVNYEAYSTDEKISYHKDEQIYVTIPQGKYEMRKFIAGRYIDNSIKEEELIYTNPYEKFIINNSIEFEPNNEVVADITINSKETITASIEKEIAFKYKNEKIFDYIGIDFAFSTDISTYMGEYALILSLYGEGNKLLSKATDNLIISSKNLYGNPYKLNSLLHFQHLFTWPKHITNITQIKRVGLQLAQNGQFDKTETDKVIKLTSATISFGYDVSSIIEDKVELYLENLEGKSNLYQNVEKGLSYTPNEDAEERTAYINWHYLNSQTNKKYLFNNYNYQTPYNNDTILNKQIYSYTFYLLHYVDGLGKNLILPDDYAWNWEIVGIYDKKINNFTYNIKPVTSFSTDQYKILIKYQTKEFKDSEKENITKYENLISNYQELLKKLKNPDLSEEEKKIIQQNIEQKIKDIQEQTKLVEDYYSYIESNGLIFKANGVTAVPGAANSSLDSLKLKLDDGDTGVYNIYGIEGSAINDSICRQPRNIHFEFLDATPYTEEWVNKVEWEFPISNTMIDYEIPEDADKSQPTFIKEGGQFATFSLKRSYKPGAMNNRIWCRVYMKSGEVRTGSLTLQFGEAINSGSNYAFNIDFVGHNACLYAAQNQTVNVQASFTKSNGEVMTPPEIIWSWKWPDEDDDTKCNGIQIITNDNNQYVTLKYINSSGLTSESQNYAILQATTAYNLENQIKTALISELPIPLANPQAFVEGNKKYTMAYISGATRVVYDSNGNNSTYSTDHYNLQAWEIENENDIKALVQYSNKDRKVSWTIINEDENNPYVLESHPAEKDQQGNIITPEEYSLQPLKYIPKIIPKVYIIASLGNNILWIQPLLITQNRWSYKRFNEWNGKLEENDEYTLIPMIGAGKKDDNNTFTGVMMGDLSKAQGQVQHTGLYGFNKGSRRFSFDDQGNAYIGNGDNYIDFDSNKGSLAIKVKKFSLQAGETSEKALFINNNEGIKMYNNNKEIISLSLTGNSQIAGFYIGAGRKYSLYDNALSKRTADSNDTTIQYEVGMKGDSGPNTLAFYVKKTTDNWANFTDLFYITHSGKLYCQNADIVGKMTATSGKIGGWTLKNIDTAVEDKFVLYSRTTDAGVGMASTSFASDPMFYAGYTGYGDTPWDQVGANWRNYTNFYVDRTGYMFCNSATIKGTLQAGSIIFPKTAAGTSQLGDLYTYTNGSGITCLLDKSTDSGARVRLHFADNGNYDGTTSGFALYSTSGAIRSGITFTGLGNRMVLYGTVQLSNNEAVTSDINKKHEITTLSSQYSTLFDNLRPVTYKYNDGTSDRLHTGFIAQEVQEALDKANINSKDFAGLVVLDRNTENELWTLRYSEFIALNTAEIQKLKTRVNSLEQEIKEIKEKYEI